jgi:hypothetical protein
MPDIRTEVVMIRALRPDPLEFHRVGPASKGTHAVFAFRGRIDRARRDEI